MKNVLVDSLIPYERNARTHSKEQIDKIAASITEFGWTNPILVDGNGIIAGHGRILAAKKLGITKVPAIDLSHLSESQKRAYIVADNKIALEAGWDDDMLALEFADLKLEGLDMGLVGFNIAELEDIMGKAVIELVHDEEPPKSLESSATEQSSEDKGPFQQMAFMLHDDQVKQVKEAIELAKKMGEYNSPNKNERGNALARICELFISQNPAISESAGKE